MMMTVKTAPLPASTAADAFAALERGGDPARAAGATRFFKTGPDGHIAGDRFLGLTAPQLHALSRDYRLMAFDQIETLLGNPVHEARTLALLILVIRYGKGSEAERVQAFDLYLANLDRVDNWDLVDGSAPYIVGPHLQFRDRTLLGRLVASPNLWRRRVAVLATLHFIRAGELAPTFALCDRLIADKQDLIHKACGWMLREAGKRDQPMLEEWLAGRAPHMPRTMLRYAIERFTPDRRRWFMQLK